MARCLRRQCVRTERTALKDGAPNAARHPSRAWDRPANRPIHAAARRLRPPVGAPPTARGRPAGKKSTSDRRRSAVRPPTRQDGVHVRTTGDSKAGINVHADDSSPNRRVLERRWESRSEAAPLDGDRAPQTITSRLNPSSTFPLAWVLARSGMSDPDANLDRIAAPARDATGPGRQRPSAFRRRSRRRLIPDTRNGYRNFRIVELSYRAAVRAAPSARPSPAHRLPASAPSCCIRPHGSPPPASLEASLRARTPVPSCPTTHTSRPTTRGP